MADREQVIREGFFFVFSEEKYDGGYLHYFADVIAGGLGSLGAPVYTNAEGSAFARRAIEPRMPCTWVFVITEFNETSDWMAQIEAFAGRRKVVLCGSDTATFLAGPGSIPCLVAHASKSIVVPGKRTPWAFGLSAARVERCGTPGAFEARRPVVLRNFRPSFSQSVRNALDLALLPHLEKHFKIDRSVGDDHFDRLRGCVACAAWGGDFATNLARNPALAEVPHIREQLRGVSFRSDPAVARWDSWRFWESLACGCLTLHIDLEKYGCLLPEMPVGWKHYIPVDLAEPRATVERLMDERARWPEISEAGRAWALQHYTPGPTAERFLAIARRL
ncbi:MAG: glycosyltransferase family 1 protein [Phycisphaerales bacterium]|nr:glycosyltransferase family 1 protein [Phycisphaerales bacterium]